MCENASVLTALARGVTRLTVTVVVIMFELTGALTYILPTMVSVETTAAMMGLHWLLRL